MKTWSILYYLSILLPLKYPSSGVAGLNPRPVTQSMAHPNFETKSKRWTVSLASIFRVDMDLGSAALLLNQRSH